jgi:hypothetical protein
LKSNRARFPLHVQSFREFKTIEQIMATVQEMVDGYLQFQIARGLLTPLETSFNAVSNSS